MQRTRRYFQRFIPQSTFSVTLATIVGMILVVWFFVPDRQPRFRFADRDDSANRDASSSSSRSIVLGPGQSYYVGPGPARDRSGPSPASVPVSPSGRYATDRSGVAPGYVASLSRTLDCRWADDADAPREGAQFRVGQTLNVANGLVELVFACGAKAILEGPAVLELQSEKAGALRSGRMTANVPDEVQFTVQTPVAKVVSVTKTELNSAARLTATEECQWASDSAVTKPGTALMPGQLVHLLDGLAEITFGSGARVILQGPARLEIESAKTAVLHSGKLVADVPDDLRGFKIHTPSADVISVPVESASQSTKPGAAPAAKATSSSRSDTVLEAAPPKPADPPKTAPTAKAADLKTPASSTSSTPSKP
jgi:hypothetical protein